MNKTIKKIIAREGLILLGFLIMGLFLAYAGDYLNQQYGEYHASIRVSEGYRFEYDVPSLKEICNKALCFLVGDRYIDFRPAINKLYLGIECVGLFLFMYGYITFLLIRFIIRAIQKRGLSK